MEGRVLPWPIFLQVLRLTSVGRMGTYHTHSWVCRAHAKGQVALTPRKIQVTSSCSYGVKVF